MASPSHPQRPTLFLALVPLLVLVLLLALNVVVFGDSGLEGPNQLALLASAAVAVVIGRLRGHGVGALLEHAYDSIRTAMGAILILLMIGALASTWLLAGIVPAMIHHGLLIIAPGYFLVAAAVASALVSIATGSSWSTAATVGIALMGIGSALGIPPGWVAGAVISGAYFGDKVSPLSDTTNLAPAVAGSELFGHIRYMLITTVPSLGIALVVFAVAGLFLDVNGDPQGLEAVHAALTGRFRIGWWSYLVPAVVIVLIYRKVPALPALFAGTLLGALFALVFQSQLLRDLAGGGSAADAYRTVIGAMGTGVSITTGNAQVDELLGSGGMSGMLGTVWLILCAMTFGGIMERTGALERITASLAGLVRGDGSLVATTAASCVVTNVSASDQYLSIVVPGRMFAPMFRARGLDPRVLSRTLEDAGTVTSPLVPWNTCGAYMATVLGVATIDYLPYAVFNLVSPLMTVLVAVAGHRILRVRS
jgi:NhaC family Na+:H+ antiporter